MNNRVAQLRDELKSDIRKVEEALARQGACTPKDKDLPYELLLDMDSFIFETRSLYEIVGKFLVELFRMLFGTTVTHADLQSILSSKGIDTRWIFELQENRKLFFHQIATWLAIEVERATMKFDPILLKRNVITFEDPDSFVSFAQLRDIYDGFVGSASELHRFVMEQIRLHESKAASARN